MGVTVAVVRVACNTSLGTQDITTTDMGGLTPKAAIGIVSYGVTDGTAADERSFSWGVTDGTREACVGGQSEHNVATTNTAQSTSANFISILNTVPAADGVAGFSAWITNGIRIDWTDPPAAAYLLTVILFGGTDLSVYVDSPGLGNTVDQATDITAPGFTPDLVICGTCRTTTNYIVGLGVVHFDGVSTITQHSMTGVDRQNRATSVVSARATSSGGILYTSNTGALDWYGEFSDFDANGFTVTTRNAGGNSQTLPYLALNFGGAVDSWVGIHTTPTSTGNDAETGPGFTPQAVYMLSSLVEAVDTAYVDNRGGSQAFNIFTSTAEYTTVVTSEDAVGTTNTQSLADDRAVVVPDDDGTLDIEADFVSMDANGWTLDYTNAPATAKLFFSLAIEEEAAASVSQVYRGKNHPSKNVLLRM